MKLVLCFLTLLTACSGESYWQFQLSPESIVSVPYGNSHISVWEHATRKGRYYAMPLVCLQSDTVRVVDNVFSRTAELEFDVLLWSREARETVYMFLKTHINASIVEEQVELLPMDKIRIVWKGRPLPDFYQVGDQWRSNTHLPTVVTFSVTCQNNERCQDLQEAIRARPNTFGEMELEYEINSQRSTRRRLTVEARHLVGGSLYASLESMPVSSPIRYLRSEDVKRLTTETLTNVISSQITDQDYVETDDENSMAELLQRVFDETKVSTADFQPAMWQSVYWNPAKKRPEKTAAYLNNVISRDATNSSNFVINQNQRTFYGLFLADTDGGSSCRGRVRKESLLKTLRERNVAVQWTGERFVPEPIQLLRLNLTRLNTSTNIATSYVQIRRPDSAVQSIKLRVSCDTNQTSRLTPELVQIRVERHINKTEFEQNKLAEVLQTGLDRLNNKLETMIWLQAFGTTSSAIGSQGPQSYCYRQGSCDRWGSSSTAYYASASLAELKTQCDQDAACTGFTDFNPGPGSRGGRTFRELCSGSISDHPYYVYYEKLSLPATTRNIMNRIILSAKIFPVDVAPNDFYCKLSLGEEYRYTS